MVLLLCTEAAGGDWRQALYGAAAVEFLHNFSLIHDDIQDNSPTRHNRPTVWRIWGLANAINAGDLLFSMAFVSLQHLATTGLAPETLLEIWQAFNTTNLELTRGQHLDMQFEQRAAVTVEEYISMIRGKSAALLSTCARIGALIACSDSRLAASYADFALNLGVAFQVRDDILGIWGDADAIGKSTITDIVSKKKSLPILYGLQQSERLAEIYAQPDLEPEDVDQVLEILAQAGAEAYAHQVETEFYAQAMSALDTAQTQGEAAVFLRQFAEVLYRRAY
jgi:geranylgeranyl diphosphate synthase type I